jgi:hypothetical protein
MPRKPKQQRQSPIKQHACAPCPAQGDAAAAAEEDEIVGRLLASAMELPRVCVFKICRRNKRCFGPHLACFEHHRGLARKRMSAAIALIANPLKGPR